LVSSLRRKIKDVVKSYTTSQTFADTFVRGSEFLGFMEDEEVRRIAEQLLASQEKELICLDRCVYSFRLH
jgi:tRNA U34 2-thiouridine synthase MnmA/TrmU